MGIHHPRTEIELLRGLARLAFYAAYLSQSLDAGTQRRRDPRRARP
jgi:hypothetical protein